MAIKIAEKKCQFPLVFQIDKKNFERKRMRMILFAFTYTCSAFAIYSTTAQMTVMYVHIVNLLTSNKSLSPIKKKNWSNLKWTCTRNTHKKKSLMWPPGNVVIHLHFYVCAAMWHTTLLQVLTLFPFHSVFERVYFWLLIFIYFFFVAIHCHLLSLWFQCAYQNHMKNHYTIPFIIENQHSGFYEIIR